MQNKCITIPARNISQQPPSPSLLEALLAQSSTKRDQPDRRDDTEDDGHRLPEADGTGKGRAG